MSAVPQHPLPSLTPLSKDTAFPVPPHLHSPTAPTNPSPSSSSLSSLSSLPLTSTRSLPSPPQRTSTRNHRPPPAVTSSDATPLVEGYLWKIRRSKDCVSLQEFSLSNAGNSVWQRRWFETRGGYLVYYATKRKKKLLAALDLSKIGQICLFRNDPTSCTFLLLVNDRPYPLRCLHPSECSDWMCVLNRIRSVKLSLNNPSPAIAAEADDSGSHFSGSSRARSHNFHLDDPVPRGDPVPTTINPAPTPPRAPSVLTDTYPPAPPPALWMKTSHRMHLRFSRFKTATAKLLARIASPLAPCGVNSTANDPVPPSSEHKRRVTSEEKQLAKIVEKHLREGKEARREIDIQREEWEIRRVEEEEEAFDSDLASDSSCSSQSDAVFVDYLLSDTQSLPSSPRFYAESEGSHHDEFGEGIGGRDVRGGFDSLTCV